MKLIKATLGFLGWPLLLGPLMGLMIVLLIPELRYSLIKQLNNLPFANVLDGTVIYGDSERPLSYANAVEQAAPAVVNIFSRKTVTDKSHPLVNDPIFRRFFNSADQLQQQRMLSALGTGVIVNNNGHILTNNHVIDQADDIIVLLRDGREARARLIGTDIATDLAVLKIDLNNLTPITLGQPSRARVGDIVLAIGNPFGMGQTVTQGIISATGRYGLGLSDYENFIQTDAAINPGNSGGALINARGDLLGINTATLDSSNSGRSVGIGFAIPADMAIQTMSEIIEFGQVIRGWLGVVADPLTRVIQNRYELTSDNGVVIKEVYENGPASVAGIQAGDIVTHINSQAIGNGRNGMYLMSQIRPGEEVELNIIRQGYPIIINAIASERPMIEEPQ